MKAERKAHFRDNKHFEHVFNHLPLTVVSVQYRSEISVRVNAFQTR